MMPSLHSVLISKTLVIYFTLFLNVFKKFVLFFNVITKNVGISLLLEQLVKQNAGIIRQT